ncbi:hypothetical protein TSUD_139590 [Trifolium subterraneum]|uniref:Uncharacterized protein n=1 Tax=Trifolium subterraneum TaxID=3900 RepID=A0A2Z6P5K0_TRISU|nr:hypothetical protein TSUD_139590 [Trifolium subterraneum]
MLSDARTSLVLQAEKQRLKRGGRDDDVQQHRNLNHRRDAPVDLVHDVRPSTVLPADKQRLKRDAREQIDECHQQLSFMQHHVNVNRWKSKDIEGQKRKTLDEKKV